MAGTAGRQANMRLLLACALDPSGARRADLDADCGASGQVFGAEGSEMRWRHAFPKPVGWTIVGQRVEIFAGEGTSAGRGVSLVQSSRRTPPGNVHRFGDACRHDARRACG